MQRTLLSSLVLSAVVVTGLSSCSMEAGGYYLTKGIWNRNLNTLTTIDCFLDCGLTSHVDGHEEYMTRSNLGYEDYFKEHLFDELSTVRNIMLVDSVAEFEILITSVHLTETTHYEQCEGEEFALQQLNADCDYTIYETTYGRPIHSGSLNTSETETTRHVDGDENREDHCVEGWNLFIGFDGMIRRLADKVVAQSTNKIRRYQKNLPAPQHTEN